MLVVDAGCLFEVIAATPQAPTMRERLAELPGVENASVDVELPIWGFPGPRAYVVEGQPLP